MNDFFRSSALAMGVALASISSESFAASYVEGVDVPSFQFGNFPPLSMESGANSVSGSLAGSCVTWAQGIDCNPASPENTQDNIHFTIQSDQSLTQIDVQYQYIFGPSEFNLSFAILDENFVQIFWAPLIPVGSTLTVPFALGPGNYWAVPYGQRANAPGEYTLSYQIGLAVAGPTTPAIPEPATWGLMIAGFGLVGVTMRRRTETGGRVAGGQLPEHVTA